jgi:hypothetical protein
VPLRGIGEMATPSPAKQKGDPMIKKILIFITIGVFTCSLVIAQPTTTPPNSCESTDFYKGRLYECKEQLREKKEEGIIKRQIPNRWVRLITKLAVPIILGVFAGMEAK